MDKLSLQKIADYTHGVLRRGDGRREITGVTTDTRNIRQGEIFLALSGDHFDGHQFLSQAEECGAMGAIVSNVKTVSGQTDDFAVIEVGDTLTAYQNLAAAYREQLSLRVVAITGSNGKTSTKDFTAAVLGQKYQVLKTEGNFNNHIGVPRTLLRASAQDEIAVLEMGMNHPGEIRPLADMAKPDVAIITNIGTAHIEFMGSREAIAQEKGVLVEAVAAQGWVILPAEDSFCAALAGRTAANVLTVGLSKGDIQAESVQISSEGSLFDVVYHGDRTSASIKVPGEHMIVNALLALGAGLALGLSMEQAVTGLESATLTQGRLQWRTVGDLQIVDDSYNANPDSMVAALKTLAKLPTSGRRIAVLGKMGELGAHSEAGHRRVGEAAVAEKFDYVLTVGTEAAIIAQSAMVPEGPEIVTFDDAEEAACFLDGMARPDDLILIKGSRSAGMERVISALAERRGDLLKTTTETTH